MPEQLEEKEQTTLSDKASSQLTEAIVTGKLEQGQKLSEAYLATHFGISRGPLREAMRQLEGMRLITRVPHAGARVIDLTDSMIEDLYNVRVALEGTACRAAAEKMTEAEIEQLFSVLDTHEQDINAVDGKRYLQSEGDLDFHYRIALGSRNQMLIQLLSDDLYQLLRMCRYRTSQLSRRTKPALKQHRQIAEAIADRDGELAELLMRRHISGAWKTMKQVMDEET